MPADVVIVGGGVIGLACGRALARRDVRVTVCEPGPVPGAASPASAGMLAAQVEAHADDHLLALAVRAREVAARVVHELAETTGIDISMPQEGIARLAFTDDDVSDLKGSVARHRQLGLRADWLDQEELRDLHPGIASNVLGAFMAFEDGSIDPLSFLEALAADCESSGVRRATAAVTRLLRESDRVSGVATSDGSIEAEVVILAAGAWSTAIGGLPRPLPIKPMRGQMLAFPWPAAEPPAVLYAEDGYLMHRRGEAIAGSTMEAAGFEVAITDEGIGQVSQTAATIFPSLRAMRPTRSWCGLRPITPDSIPLIGADPHVGGLWYATGHGRNGILLAGLTGDAIADFVVNGTSELELEACQPDRFSRRAEA